MQLYTNDLLFLATSIYGFAYLRETYKNGEHALERIAEILRNIFPKQLHSNNAEYNHEYEQQNHDVRHVWD